jgi:hypothetical protein
MPMNKHAVEVGVLAGVANLLIFQHFMPPVSDVKTADQFNSLIEGSERTALFVSIATTAIISGAVKSWDTFLVGGAIIVAIDFAYKHANAVHPDTGTMQAPGSTDMSGGNLHPLPDYTEVG